MSSYQLTNRQTPRHYVAHRAIFSIFTEEEIRKLSVKKIYKPFAFDNVGFNYPVENGLYDPALGPLTEHSSPCGTCGFGLMKCRGHFGHIELPLPVVNPLFHKVLFTILKLTCRKCFKLQFPDHVKSLIIAKVKLLEEGFVTEAYELEQEVKSSLPENDHKAVVDAYAQDIIDSYIQNLHNRERFNSLNQPRENLNVGNTRNLNMEIQKAVDEVLKSCKLGKICIYCQEPFPKVTSSANRIMTPSGSKESLVNSKSIIHKQNIIPIFPDQSKKYLRKLWANDKEMLKVILPILGSIHTEFPTDIFFFNIIPVTPPVVRPISMLDDQIMEHPRTQTYKYIIQNSLILWKIIQNIKTKTNEAEGENEENETQQSSKKKKKIEEIEDLINRMMERVRGDDLHDKLRNSWQELQVNVNHLMDRDMVRTSDSSSCFGLKQMIEKKDGIIRMHMMGKRVNYAARSVITPDPNLDIDEIGIPETFALKLTYPVPVTPWNVTELKRMIINGPDVHPGATLIQYEDGTVKRINAESLAQREGIAKTLLTKSARANQFFDGVKIVHRHLLSGDMVLINRQPTLHRPSIMAHRARVLKSEKTLRLHYANCKAFNADFDGDEMNVHFLQNEVARSEAKFLINAANQYLVPKDGTPLSSLIQDHIIAGVRLTMRGTFFEKEDYQSLIFSALWSVPGDITLLPPTILKPKRLWSGKQLLSTLLINLIPKGRAKINLTGTSKISIKEWTVTKPRVPKCGIPFEDPRTMSEVEVIIRNGELLCGVLDKAHYGATPYGLIHCVHELYGGTVSINLLSSFGKMFQNYLLHMGFTLGVKDILVKAKANKERKKLIKKSRQIGEELQRSALGLSADTPMSEVAIRMEEEYANNPRFRTQVDRKYKTALDVFSNDINKACLPLGLIEKFPNNNLQLMVQSGAKGSTVNTMQISCLLGQIELEGKRPPLMISGRSLPCFPPYDPSPRAGGFIDGRFMTGIEPPEFFFHCMAGREGLIDTAVKTSRSGYLQRCLVKHLEGVSVHYDSTVRDTDGSVIQFQYGEDGMDICNSKFLNMNQLDFLVDNKDAIMDQELVNHLKDESLKRKISKHVKKIKKWEIKHGSCLVKRRTSPFAAFSAENVNPASSKRNQINPGCGRSKTALSVMKKWIKTDDETIQLFKDKAARCPDPVTSKYRSDIEFGALSESLEKLMDDYLEMRRGKISITKSELRDLISLKSMMSLCPPGEPVGLLAAQSIGEPSTQMTLNTFHFAGRGEMNVTLGIPRLREILMLASKKIKTPSMEIPFKKDIPKFTKQVAEVRRKLTKCILSDVVEDIDVDIKFSYKPQRQLIYKIKLNILPKKYYKHEYHVSPSEIISHIENSYFKEMFREIKKAGRASGVLIYIDDNKNKEKERNARLDEEDGEEIASKKSRADHGEMHESSDEEQVEEADASIARTVSRHQENQEYDDPEEEEVVVDEIEDETTTEQNLNSNLNTNDEDVDENDFSLKRSKGKTNDRRVAVANAFLNAIEYDYDEEKEEWCSLVFKLPLKMYKLDIKSILISAASKVVLWETPNIKRAFTFQNSKGETILKTEGINVVEIFKYHKLLQLDRLYSNDIYAISQTYGIEAANRVVVKEVKDVFKVYGIAVNSRHLSLIADYMTFDGNYQPMNRKGMEHSASPLQQMSFESSLQFLKNATLQGKSDDLKSPSSRLMVGLPSKIGTGSIDVLVDLRKILESQQSSSIW